MTDGGGLSMASEPLLAAGNGHGDNHQHSFDFDENRKNNRVFEKETESFLLPQLSVKLKHDIILVKKKRMRQQQRKIIGGMKGNQEENDGWGRIWIVRWGHSRVVDPFFIILSRGLEPKLLSFSMALGITFGLFPVWGPALIFCAVSALVLQSKCHVPTLMLSNFLVAPFELGMMVPFMRIGELITGGDHFVFSPAGLWEVLKGRHSRELMFGVLHAVIGWSVLAPICVCLVYAVALPVFGFLVLRFRSSGVQQDEFSPAYDGPLIVRLDDGNHSLVQENAN